MKYEFKYEFDTYKVHIILTKAGILPRYFFLPDPTSSSIKLPIASFSFTIVQLDSSS